MLAGSNKKFRYYYEFEFKQIFWLTKYVYMFVKSDKIRENSKFIVLELVVGSGE